MKCEEWRVESGDKSEKWKVKSGKWIKPECGDEDVAMHKPASYLYKRFNVEQVPGRAKLFITCHGVYEAYINGNRVGDFYLAPGVMTYEKKLTYQTYDVTSVIKTGENEILVVLGDGWYRSCSGVDGDRNLFGEDLALLCEICADGNVVCQSDETWEATQSGPIRQNDLQQGEIYDANLETLAGWHSVTVCDYNNDILVPQDTPFINRHEQFEGKLLTAPNGETVIDFGQNLAGIIRFTIEGAHSGDTLIISAGECLDEDGNFTASNFNGNFTSDDPKERTRHGENGVKQRLVYICKDGDNSYESHFTIWGFRYLKVVTDGYVDLSKTSFTSIAVYSDMEQTAWFSCGDERVNRLFENSLWSMKSNFCDVPTDCPTRERAAWTGDMGVFINTGLYLMDCEKVVRKWLSECRMNQYEDGRIANIAPRNGKGSMFTGLLAGSVGWGDACIIVPYTIYERTGDKTVLEENYEMMCRWHAFETKRADADWALESRLGLDYGEWCEPGSEGNVAAIMGTPQKTVTNAYYAYSSRLMSIIAGILGKREDSDKFGGIAIKAAEDYRKTATDNGRIHSNRQAEYVRAIAFQLLDDEEIQTAADDLDELVAADGYHLNTGFLSTPFLCKALSEHGHLDTAYKLLLQDTYPSWLYAIEQGATTIWETWDGKASQNHYSYGAVCGWLIENVCGVKFSYVNPSEALTDSVSQETGCCLCLTIKPQPSKALGHAEVVYDSPIGRIESSWKYEAGSDTPTYRFVIPDGVKADIELEDGRKMTLSAGEHVV